MTHTNIALTVNDEEMMLNTAAQLAGGVEKGCILLLQGNLGAGKTTFARGFLRGLGFNGKVKSPTYTIVEPYTVHNKQIFHFDFYRIERERELDEMGFNDYFSANAICLIEWPEKVVERIPKADILCTIDIVDEKRLVNITSMSRRGDVILKKAGL